MRPFLFSLPASFETYQGLGNFMYEHDIKQEMYELVDSIINEWMEGFRNREAQRAADVLDGYQWKCLFLPDGTTLRTVYKRKSYLAHVEGSEIRFAGRSVSPGQFVDEVAQCPRNAWRTIWLRFPNDAEWKQAMTLRTLATEAETKRVDRRPK